MCVIIQLKPNSLISFDKFKNATLNNPDGWGLITKDRGKLEEIRGFHPDGTDPEVVYKHLGDALSVERYVHLRKNTVGKNSLENTHPFKVMDGDRKIYFFHNGTIGSFRPGQGSDASDTRNFAETFLSPLLYKLKGDKGFGDYTDPFFETLFKATFNGGYGRVLLLSNDLENKEFGDWRVLSEPTGDGDLDYRVSNLDYFSAPQTHRMTEAQRSSHTNANFRSDVEKAEAARSEARTPSSGNGVRSQLANLKDVNLAKLPGRSLRPSETASLAAYLDANFEEIDNDTLALCAYVTGLEIESWVVAHPETASSLLEQMFIRFSDLNDEYNGVDEARMEAVRKHEKATQVIADLKNEIAQLQSLLGNTKAPPSAKGKVAVRKRNAVAVQAVEEQVA